MTQTQNLMKDVHREAVTATVQELAATLQDLLSRRIVVVLAGVENGKTVTRWVKGESTTIRDPLVEQKLRTAYEIARLLLQFDSYETVRAWFIGLNPQLDDESPVTAIAAGKLKEARSAARAFISGG